jgi:hypothetical protein
VQVIARLQKNQTEAALLNTDSKISKEKAFCKKLTW